MDATGLRCATTVPPDPNGCRGYRCQVCQRQPAPSGSADSAVSAASSPGNTPPKPPGLGRAPLAEVVCEAAKFRLVGFFDAGFEAIAGRFGVLGQAVAVVAADGARDLLGEGGPIDGVHRDDVRRAQHSEQQRAALGVVVADRWPGEAVRPR